MTELKKLLISCIIGLCIISIPFKVRAEEEKQNVIRVGYMDYSGFIEKQEDGTFQGYAVSYLNEIAKFTGWTYEYEYDNWQNCLDKLEAGELDLICSAQYTKERAEIFAYSDIPIGSESAVMYTMPDNNELYYEDFDKIDGLTFGVLADSYQTTILPQYAAEHHFSYHEIVYPSEVEMKRALEDGNVDVIVSGSLALHNDLKVLGMFGSAPFYIISGKANEELINDVNHALNEMKGSNPWFESDLHSKYYAGSSMTTSPLFTREEAEYIRESKPIKLAFWGNVYPLSSYDSEEKCCVGIEEDIMDLVSKNSGLEFEYIPLLGEKKPDERLKDGDVDLIVGMDRSESFLEDPELQVSNQFFQSNDVIVQKKGNSFSDMSALTIAIPFEYQSMELFLKKQYPQCNIYYGKSTEECLDAVLKGDSDIAVQNTYVISYLLQQPRYSKLTVLSGGAIVRTPCVIGNMNVDPALFSILNKTINCLDEDAVQQIVVNHTVANPYQSTIHDFIYQYYYAWILLGVILILLVIGITIVYRLKIGRAIQEKETELLRIRAEFDSLTKIYNRDTFFEKVQAVLGKNPEVKCDIICMDVDRFKIVNDLFGTEAGDKLLKYIASVLEYHTEKRGGICGRIGGNSFAVYVPHDEVALNGIYEFSKKEISKYPLDMDITMRFGVYYIERDVDISAVAMSDRARMAMEQVKGNAISHVGIYNQQQRVTLLREQDIINEMQNALDDEQFKVFIQPKYNINTKEIIGGEALVRWLHPTKGMISPGEFIPVFEKNGFITKLDAYMWEKTCMLLHKWKEQGVKIVPISVNISRINFYTMDLKQHLLELLQNYDLRTEELELEVTESAIAEDDAKMYQMMLDLQQAGFRVLMDDFGSGYSSLNMLKEAPINEIKIDLRFLQGSDPLGRSMDIIGGVMSMARTMGISVIAEGVETEENVKGLRKIYCDLAQGFYFSRPVPSEAFLIMLQKNDR